MADINKIIPFTYKWEGGLSRASTDTASKNPSPYVINGVTGWHTNKGITYPVFKSGAAKHGYADTADNFAKMPEHIWLKIAKSDFWDKLNLDNVKSQAIANIMFSWIWGSGYSWVPRLSTYLKSKGINWEGGKFTGKGRVSLDKDFNQLYLRLNQLTDKIGEKKAVDDLIEQKKQFLLSLNQKVNERGWMNRLNELQSYSYQLLSKTAQKVKDNPMTAILITSGLIVGTYVLIKTLNKK